MEEGDRWSLELSTAASEEEEKFFAAAVLLATRPEIVEGSVWAAGEGLISRSKRVVGWRQFLRRRWRIRGSRRSRLRERG